MTHTSKINRSTRKTSNKDTQNDTKKLLFLSYNRNKGLNKTLVNLSLYISQYSHHGQRFTETAEGKINRAANIKSSHDHPLPLHHQPPQVWGCCTYLQKQGCLLSSLSTNALSHHSSEAASDPQWLNEKWYSPASESACCYGNTSHLICSHPTLLPVSWQWWQKKSYKNNREDREEDTGKGETWCSDRYSFVHWWNVDPKKHMFMDCWVIKNILINV